MKEYSRADALASRKFLLTVISIMLITLMCYLGIHSPSIQSILPSFNSGVLGVLGLYFAGNVGSAYVKGKNKNNDGEE